MKEKVAALRIFQFSHPLMQTEMLSVLGDKYSHVLPFEWELVKDLSLADVILWDGIVTPKNTTYVERFLETLQGNRVLLIFGESMTLFKNHPLVRKAHVPEEKLIELPGWNILPEEILAAFELCREKLRV